MTDFGIPQMVVIIALLGFALWKQGWFRVILSISIIAWGAFAMSYDIKIAAPLIGIGTILFLAGTFRLIQQSRERETT